MDFHSRPLWGVRLEIEGTLDDFERRKNGSMKIIYQGVTFL